MAALVKYCFLKRKNTPDAKQWLDKCYSKYVPAYSIDKYRFPEFRRLEEAVMPQKIAKIREIMLGNRKMKLSEFIIIKMPQRNAKVISFTTNIAERKNFAHYG